MAEADAEELGQQKQSPGTARPEKPTTHEPKVTTRLEPERVESNRPNFSETLISSVSRLKLTTANSRSDGRAPRAAQIQLGKSTILELTTTDFSLRGLKRRKFNYDSSTCDAWARGRENRASRKLDEDGGRHGASQPLAHLGEIEPTILSRYNTIPLSTTDINRRTIKSRLN